MTLYSSWEGTQMSYIQQDECELKKSKFKISGFIEKEHLTHNFLIM